MLDTDGSVLYGVREIASGRDHTVLIKEDNTVWSVGFNGYGQLGLGDTINRTEPEKIKAEKILEIFTSGDEGSNFEDIIEGQPYFGTIMRYGSDKFDDNLEIFKAAKQGKEQEKYQ